MDAISDMNSWKCISKSQIADVCVPLIFYICGEWEYDFAIKVATDHEFMSKQKESKEV